MDLCVLRKKGKRKEPCALVFRIRKSKADKAVFEVAVGFAC